MNEQHPYSIWYASQIQTRQVPWKKQKSLPMLLGGSRPKWCWNSKQLANDTKRHNGYLGGVLSFYITTLTFFPSEFYAFDAGPFNTWSPWGNHMLHLQEANMCSLHNHQSKVWHGRQWSKVLFSTLPELQMTAMYLAYERNWFQYLCYIQKSCVSAKCLLRYTNILTRSGFASKESRQLYVLRN